MTEKTKNAEILANLKAAGVNLEDDEEGQRVEMVQSHVNAKIARNTKGDFPSIHVYEGATKEMVDEVVKLVKDGFKQLTGEEEIHEPLVSPGKKNLKIHDGHETEEASD